MYLLKNHLKLTAFFLLTFSGTISASPQRRVKRQNDPVPENFFEKKCVATASSPSSIQGSDTEIKLSCYPQTKSRLRSDEAYYINVLEVSIKKSDDNYCNNLRSSTCSITTFDALIPYKRICNGQQDCEIKPPPSQAIDCDGNANFAEFRVNYECVPESLTFNICDDISEMLSNGFIYSPEYGDIASFPTPTQCGCELYTAGIGLEVKVHDVNFTANDQCNGGGSLILDLQDPVSADQAQSVLYCNNIKDFSDWRYLSTSNVSIFYDAPPHASNRGFLLEFRGRDKNDGNGPSMVDVYCMSYNQHMTTASFGSGGHGGITDLGGDSGPGGEVDNQPSISTTTTSMPPKTASPPQPKTTMSYLLPTTSPVVVAGPSGKQQATLSEGAVIGISIGSTLVVLIVIIVAVVYYCRNKQAFQSNGQLPPVLPSAQQANMRPDMSVKKYDNNTPHGHSVRSNAYAHLGSNGAQDHVYETIPYDQLPAAQQRPLPSTPGNGTLDGIENPAYQSGPDADRIITPTGRAPETLPRNLSPISGQYIEMKGSEQYTDMSKPPSQTYAYANTESSGATPPAPGSPPPASDTYYMQPVN